ncbi:MAG TPA: ABC transporter ATP-binding protein [Acidimicrobiia bacterium]|nr:ABC transporter ATP-binding protein [Acidimicrobiia bacterium]
MSASSNAEAMVRVEGLSKVYRPTPGWMRALVRTVISEDVVALDDVSFTVGRGEVCALVGPNGAGKTTAFRILVGLTTPTSGRAIVMGHDSHHESLAVRQVVGWMPAEERSLLMRLTSTENLYFHGRLQGLKGRDLQSRIAAVLDRIGLGDKADDSVISLSAGMRARLQLARALLHDPRVLILDEPTGSVDPVAAHEILGLITSVVEERGMAALISSHRLEEIEALQSHVVLLDQGKVRYDGDLEALRKTWDRHRIEVQFSTAERALEAARLIGNAGIGTADRVDEGTVLLTPTDDVSVGRMIAELGPLLAAVVYVREIRTPLRDVLAGMYRRRESSSHR